MNPHPTTSLFSLIKAYNEKLGEGDEPLPVPTIEESLAKILATFEAYWDVFVSAEGSGFEPFLSEYLDRWLHSYVSILSSPCLASDLTLSFSAARSSG